MGILKRVESRVLVCEHCRKHEISSASVYKWRAKFGAMDASLTAEMKDLAEQNRRLKKMYAVISLRNDLLKEASVKSAEAVSKVRDGYDGSRTKWRQHCAGRLWVSSQRDVLSARPYFE